MINANMRQYDYFTLGDINAYGQHTMPSADAEPVGKVLMAIYVSSQSIQDNINYKDAQYIALTNANVDDTYIIKYGEERLKVLYVNRAGRFNQVFLSKI